MSLRLQTKDQKGLLTENDFYTLVGYAEKVLEAKWKREGGYWETNLSCEQIKQKLNGKPCKFMENEDA